MTTEQSQHVVRMLGDWAEVMVERVVTMALEHALPPTTRMLAAVLVTSVIEYCAANREGTEALARCLRAMEQAIEPETDLDREEDPDKEEFERICQAAIAEGW